MINEVLLVHHSHTDIGYTHPQPVVLELHRRFIDEALDHADATIDWPDDSRFRWTCEVTGVTRAWWESASTRQRDRFLAAVARGQFEVAAMRWNMTPLMDHRMLQDALADVAFFRDLGAPVTSAMNSDVNGLPWGMVDALLDHGVNHLSMAINEYFGHALRPWPRGFRWESPSGRRLLAYNGYIYGITSEMHARIPRGLDEAKAAVPAYLAMWEQRGYPYPFLMFQATNIGAHDNAAPNLDLSRFVRTWNETGAGVRMRTVTLTGFFEQLAAQPDDTVPTMRGDWTDWWNFGSGSTAASTAMALEGQRALREAEQIRAWPGAPRGERLVERARQAALLFAEHTWGADRSIDRAASPETAIQLQLKTVSAPESLSLARMVRRDGLETLAARAGGEDITALVWNPHPFPVRCAVRLPWMGRPGPATGTHGSGEDWSARDMMQMVRPQSHAVQRQDVVLADHADGVSRWVGPLDLPALGYRALRYSDLVDAGPVAVAVADGLSSERVDLRLDPAGGLASLRVDGREYAARSLDGWRFGCPVHERPALGTRNAIFGPISMRDDTDWYRGWHPDWEAERSGPTEVVNHAPTSRDGATEVAQSMRMEGGDLITTTYRLVPGTTAVEVVVDLVKAPRADPHALYLALPLALEGPTTCHFETAGAVVELDEEQLPYSSRHYITTQRWIRLAGSRHELTVATPDAPLWQVGGFTFGRHRNGVVERPEPLLLAWLTNNYWITNFQADQSGHVRYRFHLLAGDARPLSQSIEAALVHAAPPSVHLYSQHGPQRREAESLFSIDSGGAQLSGVHADGEVVRLDFLNPGDEDLHVRVGPGAATPTAAWLCNVAGERGAALALTDGFVRLELPARTWRGMEVHL